jgi:Na+/H+ antiporter NhaA
MTKLAFQAMPEIKAEATLAVIVGSLISLAVGALLSQVRGKHYSKLAKKSL